jgi:serralysin
VVATGATATEVGHLVTHLANIATGGITGDLALTSAVTDTNITALFGKYAGVTATAVVTGMGADQITALVGAKMSATGITGDVTNLNAAALTALAGKAANIGDGTLTGALSVSSSDFAAFSDLQTKLATSATVSISGVADEETVTVINFLNSSFTGTTAGTTGKFVVTAGAGNQAIATGSGDDVITGGAGADTLTGGEGADTFVFAASTESSATVTDKIIGFVAGSDKIQFKAVGNFELITDNGTISGALDLAEAVAAAYELVANGSKNIEIDAFQFEFAGKTYFAVESAVDGGAIAALVIEVTGVSGNVTEADFILPPIG